MATLIRSLMAAAAMLPVVCHTAPVTYEFTVTAITGPLAGVSSTGTFSFEDTIVPAGGGALGQMGLLSDLSFVWDGLSYDETTANTGRLTFDSTGDLIGFSIGNQCGNGFCLTGFGPNEWYVAAIVGADDLFAYGADTGSLRYALMTSTVPEPAGIALAGLALAALGVTRARRLRG